MEEKLVLEYIGKNADKIINKKLNWPAAILSVFLGPVWFFYRKSYLLGFILLYFMGIGFYYYTGLGHFISWGLFIGIAIKFLAYLFFANTLYLLDVKRKVKKMMLSSNNLSEEQLSSCEKEVAEANIGPIHVDEKTLISKVREKGGTSANAVGSYIMFLIIVGIVIVYAVLKFCYTCTIFFFKVMMEMLG